MKSIELIQYINKSAAMFSVAVQLLTAVTMQLEKLFFNCAVIETLLIVQLSTLMYSYRNFINCVVMFRYRNFIICVVMFRYRNFINCVVMFRYRNFINCSVKYFGVLLLKLY